MKKPSDYTFLGVFLIVISVFMGLVLLVAASAGNLAPGYSPSNVLIFPILFMLPGIWCVLRGKKLNAEIEEAARKKRAKEKKKAEEEYRYRESVHLAGDDDSLKFYRSCVEEKIKDMDKESDRERLVLYAQRNLIKGTKEELVAAFQKGKNIASGIDKAAEIERLKNEELTLEEMNRSYLGYTGRDKIIKKCNDEIQNYEKQIAECRKEIDKIQNGGASLYQKEHSWATAGGIANGIAGPAAGIVAAAETQQKNVEIRAGNEMLASMVIASTDPYYATIVRAEKQIEVWKKRLEKAEKCLVETKDNEYYMQQLEIVVKEKKLSETGNGRVKLEIKQKNPFCIFGDADAVVDGSLRVLLKSNGENVGDGIYCFPYNGSKSPKSPVIVCRGKHIPEVFDVEVIPDSLWGIEKID